MSHTELIAIEKFAKDLKDLEFPIIDIPKSYRDEIMNSTAKYAHRRIDTALRRAKDEFDRQADKEAVNYGA